MKPQNKKNHRLLKGTEEAMRTSIGDVKETLKVNTAFNILQESTRDPPIADHSRVSEAVDISVESWSRKDCPFIAS